MSLVSGDGPWTINRINAGPPYKVTLVGPYSLPQVTDARGVAALSGPSGAVFQASVAQAEEACAMANEGKLNKQ